MKNEECWVTLKKLYITGETENRTCVIRSEDHALLVRFIHILYKRAEREFVESQEILTPEQVRYYEDYSR